MRHTLLVLLVVLPVAVPAPKLKDRPKPDGSIVGTWQAVQIVRFETDLTDRIKILTYSFRADGIHVGQGYDMPYELNPAGDRSALDLGGQGELSARYRVEGDTLILCLSGDGKRPSALKPGPTVIYLEMRRVVK